jgi:hypothetical protein
MPSCDNGGNSPIVSLQNIQNNDEIICSKNFNFLLFTISMVFPQLLIVIQQFKNLPVVTKPEKFIPVFTKAHYWTLS